ncbi:MAG: sulfatase/phosphatase domain-containing protein, partial [Planctomycetota bacterium]
PRAKRYINDTGTHVPLIVSFPERWQHLAPAAAGTVSDRPVAFIDLPPTAFSLAGVEIPEQFQGRAFAGKAAQESEPYAFLYGQRFDSRMLRCVRAVTDGEYRYIRNFHPHRHRGILTGYPHGQVGWQSLYRLRQAGKLNDVQSAYWDVPQPVEELYHTDADPWELNNLVDDPKQQERLARMREATLSKMREIGDTGIVPESMYEGISQKSTVYEYVHNDDFPYEDVLGIALKAGSGEANAMKDLQSAMKHQHPVIRFWGATGCTIQGKAPDAAIEALKQLQQDESDSVRLAASEALFVLDERDAGFNGLLEIMKETKDPVVSLEALNLTQALGVMKDVPKEIWARASKQGGYSKRMASDQENPNLQ